MKKSTITIGVLIVLVIVVFILIRPGVFTIQPIGAIPEGATIIYHSRSSELSSFSSPDSMCLELQGGVSLLCRGIALGAATDLLERKITQLPSSEWAYLQSTGGRAFDQ